MQATTLVQCNLEDLRKIVQEAIAQQHAQTVRADKLLTKAEAMKMLNVTRVTLNRYIKQGLYKTTPDGRMLPLSQFI